MNDEEITKRLKVLGDEENHLGDTPEQRKKQLMRFERTRHFMVWEDGSTILNHSHLLCLIQRVYDPAFVYTAAEMKDRRYGVIDVLTLVEKPHIYILGRCSGKEVEQLGYIETRRQ